MKKIFNISLSSSKTFVILPAMLGIAALVQACGASSGGSSSAQGLAPGAVGCPINAFGQQVCQGVTSTSTNQALGQACSSIQSAQQQLSQYIPNAQVTNATAETSPDGTAVCRVQFMQQPNYQGSRAFLGPNSGNGQGINTGIQLQPYDLANVTTSGTYTTGFFGGCGSNSVNGLLEGYVSGINYFVVGGMQLVIPVNGGGPLVIGLNQSQGSGGGMCLTIDATITRCIDSSGNSHPC